MKIFHVLREECIVANAEFRDKAAALREIVRVARKSPILEHVAAEEILHGLETRESLGSTGFGKGIAIPHCRLKSVRDFVVGLITIPGGVDFEALDGQKVRLIIFIIAPENESSTQIKLLSAISQTLLITGVVDEILAGDTPEALRESFLRHTRADIDTKDQTSKNLFHVFVQDEQVFRDILHLLTGTEASSLVVLDGKNAGAYLAKMPLFADFWRDESRQLTRIIIAVVEKGLTNETLRRIESITGHLDEGAGVMVTIQEISYSTGSLSAQP